MSTKISILMPAYNAEKYLNDCIPSIQKQPFNNWELYAIDDFSTDKTYTILKKIAAKDNRIHVLKNTEKGIIPALRFAFEQSIGHVITRMDADDIMPPNKLADLYKALDMKDNLVSTGFVKYISDGILGEGYKKYERWLNGLCAKNSHFDEIYKECVIPSPCWMMTRKTLNDIGAFYPNRYPEDYDLCFRMYAHQLDIACVQNVCHIWRDHDNRASRNDENYANNTFLALKCSYFLKLDYDRSKNLVLWGLGRKGKTIARYFINEGIQFEWICDNEKKIGHDIYGKIIQDSKSYTIADCSQLIIAVANENEKKQIQSVVGKCSAWFFC